MRRHGARVIAGGIAVLVGLAMAIPAFSATGNGSITITSPKANAALSKTQAIEWVWRSGTYVKSSSLVNVQISPNGYSWTTIAKGVKITKGAVNWDTKVWLDAPYAVRAVVSGTTINSMKSPVFVDNTVPTVRITHPSEGEIVVDGAQAARFAVVVGTAQLQSESSDNLTGVKTVEWFLDETTSLGIGPSIDASFNDVTPGQHTLTATATDYAGNPFSVSINLLVSPGPSKVSTDPGTLPSPDPNETPSVPDVPQPDPSVSPTVPSLPSPDPIATPTVPAVPSPDPSQSPPTDGVPNPMDLIPVP